MANLQKQSALDSLSKREQDMLKTPLNEWAPQTIKATQEDIYDHIHLENIEQDKMKKKLIGVELVCGEKGCKETEYALITKAARQSDGSKPKILHQATCKACHHRKDITHLRK